MKVVLYGATGTIGSRILKELLSRGHKVTAVVRDPAKLPAQPNVSVVKGDLLDTDNVAQVVKNAEAVVSSYGPPHDPARSHELVDSTKSMIAGMRRAGVTRLIMVGGAGSLEVAPGVQVVDAPGFPEQWKSTALAHRDAYHVLREADMNWTYFSPAAMIQPGERTGKFRLGRNALVKNDKGESSISAEDYAVALVDELESARHARQRFTAAY